MGAMTGSADCPPDRLATTRTGLHRVAEHILAAARYAANGKIGLIPSPGGFRTPPLRVDGRFLAVDGAELVVSDAAGTRRTAPATIRATRTFRQIGTVAEAAAFFRDGRARARAATSTETRRTP
jgi:hypothetical protein